MSDMKFGVEKILPNCALYIMQYWCKICESVILEHLFYFVQGLLFVTFAFSY